MSVTEAVTLIGAITAAIVSIVSAISALRTGTKVEQVHTMVNGQSARMESLAQQTGFAQGTMGNVGSPPTRNPWLPPQTKP